MTLSAPARRLASRCLTSHTLPIRTLPPQQRRTATSNSSNSNDEPSSNPVLDEFRQKNPHTLSTAPDSQAQDQTRPAQGDIASSSIFEDDRRTQTQLELEAEESSDASGTRVGGILRDPVAMARVLHPDPGARERWERKKVIQMVKKGGRLTKEQFLKRTEREHLLRSHNMKTSVKKLGMIARQIAGKGVEDAIVQMRFSKKKVAQEVLKQLEYARDQAVTMRGMGLGLRLGKGEAAGGGEGDVSSTDVTGTESGVLEAAKTPTTREEEPVEIQLKDGKRHKISDPSTIYIDQAWVGRGPYGRLPDYRARGRKYIMRTPWTSLSVVLKEETTRIRQHEEREAKRRRKITDKVWVHLPDRPLTTNRQWYSW